MRWPAVVVLLAVVAGLAEAGTESAPEVSDDPGDAAGTGASAGAAADVVAAWVDTEDASVFNIVLRLGATPAPASGESYTYTIHVTANGTEHEAIVTIGSGGPQASGVASGAFLSGSRLQVTLSRLRLGDPAPGTDLGGLYVEAQFESVLPVLTAADRAPDSGTGSNYTVGTLAGPAQDFDGDGLGDRSELGNGTDPARADTDGDGLDDRRELGNGTDPRKADSDGDGLGDGDERGRGTDPRLADSDGDGAKDGDEVAAGTDPRKGDSDGDGLGDGDEATRGSDPLKGDTDGDGLDDGRETLCGTSATARDTDGDGTDDPTECRRAGITQGPASDSANGTTPDGSPKKSPPHAPAVLLTGLAFAAVARRRLA